MKKVIVLIMIVGLLSLIVCVFKKKYVELEN